MSTVKQVYNNITQSQGDQRLYRGLLLNNDMKVLLVSDESTDKSAASMNVHIGAMTDPVALPGLAHFCEHMLFLGTEKYPESNMYHKFIQEHGGSNNAYTSGEQTNYYFDIAPQNLGQALDRFAQFFLCPLFTAEFTEKELNAVDSEHEKNIKSDIWRMNQIEKSTALPGHDYTKFSTGNRTTLKTLPDEAGIDVREALLTFHKKYYSSNIMALAVLGKESLDELQSMVVEHFSNVENKNVQIPKWEQHPYGPDQLQKKISIVPVKDLKQLNLNFPIPDLRKYYKAQPGHYLSHLIGHEGPGSLLSELKRRGWVNALVGGEQHGANGFSFFCLNVELSDSGTEHIEEIISLMFEYIALLRKSGPQEWIFNELKDLSAMSFRFKSKEQPMSYVLRMSGELHEYPMNEVLSAPYYLEQYEPELIKMVLSKLTPQNCRIMAVGQSYESVADEKEKWYGTKYKMEQVSPQLINQWSSMDGTTSNDKLRLPDPNDFIPTNFDIKTREKEIPQFPELTSSSPLGRLWYKQDDKFLLPRAYLTCAIYSPLANITPHHANMMSLLSDLFSDALNEYSYSASLAGLNGELNSNHYGLRISVNGYNDKMSVMLKKVIDKLTHFDIDPDRFNILKDELRRRIVNHRANQPYQHAFFYTNLLLEEQAWSHEERLNALDELSLDALKSFIPELLSRTFLEMLVYGNVTKQEAIEYREIIEKHLTEATSTKPLLPTQVKKLRCHAIPQGKSYVFEKGNEVHPTNCTEAFYQTDVEDNHSNMTAELFAQIANEPCFNQLRTEEQLGYIVFTGVRRTCGVNGIHILVQSDRPPKFLENRIEQFLFKFKNYLSDMSADEFKTHVEALATKRLIKPKKMMKQHSDYWSEISPMLYHFDRDNLEVEHLRTLTKDDLISFYDEYLRPGSAKRKRLTVHVPSAAPSPVVPENAMGDSPDPEGKQDVEMTETDAAVEMTDDAAAAATTDNSQLAPEVVNDKLERIDIKDISMFKRHLALHPLPHPHMCVPHLGAKL